MSEGDGSEFYKTFKLTVHVKTDEQNNLSSETWFDLKTLTDLEALEFYYSLKNPDWSYERVKSSVIDQALKLLRRELLPDIDLTEMVSDYHLYQTLRSSIPASGKREKEIKTTLASLSDKYHYFHEVDPPKI